MKRLSIALTFALVVTAGTLSSGTRVRAQQPADQLAAGISPEALAQIDALIREKDSRTPAQQKVDSQLLYELKMAGGVPIADGIAAIETDLPYAADGHLVVDIATRPGNDLAARLIGVGLDVESVSADGTSVRAHINIGDVEAIAADAAVLFVQPKQIAITRRVVDPPAKPGFPRRATAVRAFLAGAIGEQAEPNLATPTGQGSRSSEGDVTHRAFVARGAYHVDGTGVKIGVLSDGVSNLAASQARGDLGPVTVLPLQTGSGDEGTAMLEIVHDLAPGAQLFFATAFSGINNFAKNIRDLRAAGCDIIIDDVFYFVETPFEDGQPAPTNTNGGAVIQAVNDVTAAGAMYFSSAGNSGNLDDGTSGTWEGDFVDGGATALPLPAGGRVHNFGGQNFDVLTVAGGSPVNLYWSDPLGGSSNDYDLFRLNAAGTIVLAASTNIQSGTQDPYEQMTSGGANPAAAGQRIVIVKKLAAAARFLHLGTNRARLSIATSGETHGHNSAANAFGVAATPAVGPFPQAFSAANSVEPFSSDGPRRVFYQANGAAYTPGNVSSTGGLLRQQPVITAADGVSVTGVGGFPSPFFGTSAAAPHAGAIAALIKSANPALTPAQIRTILVNTAIDIEAPGVDRDAGFGIVMANAAVGATGITGTAFLALETIQSSDNPGNGNGVPEAGEGARLTLTLKNYGVAPATNIAAALATSTPGITITQPNTRAYPDLAVNASAANAPPLLYTVAAEFPCPKTANFSLNVSLQGGPNQMLPFGIPIGPPPYTITTILDNIAPPVSPGVLTTTGSQNLRLNRNGIASACGAPKAFPGTFGTGTRAFEAYAFQTCAASAPSCVNVALSSTPVGGNAALFASTYQPAFIPSNIATNYKADAGVSNLSGAFTGYSFDLGSGAQTFVVDVNEVNQGLGVGATYTLNVSGACLGACAPPNHPPVAKAKNVTVAADNLCLGTANVDDGSFDPDGDPITLVQAPPNPYQLGATSVLLTVSDPKGAMSQATAIVTVADQTGPSITGVAASPSSLWPPNHEMVNVTVNYGQSDNCPGNVSCVLSVSSNESSNNKEPDWVVVDAHHVLLRAERAGNGVGRLYTITLTCTDAAGNVTVKTATVLVPHDQRGN